jgi:tellurite resistance protein
MCAVKEFWTMTAARKLAQIVPPQHALIYVMVMQSAADAQMSDQELGVIGDLTKHLPVFKHFDINELPEVARECAQHLAQDNGMMATLQIIKASLPERLRDTAYAVACDVAAADGKLADEEKRMLELLRRELSIDALHACALEWAARARYLVA